MKKIFAVLSSFTLFFFIFFVLFSLFYGNMPLLLEGQRGLFRFFRALDWFFTFLPAIMISGFMAGCSIQWKRGENGSKKRFSNKMLLRFRNVMICGIIMAFLLTLVYEAFSPALKNKMQNMKESPLLLKEDLEMADYYRKNDKPLLAWQYARSALALDPENEEVKAVYKLTSDEKDLAIAEENEDSSSSKIEKIQTPLASKNSAFSVKELLEKAQYSYDSHNWFNAHYWASLALKTASPTDTNVPKARDLANSSWNKLEEKTNFYDENEARLYSLKKEGYKALNSSYYLKAYYLFLRLSRESEEVKNDPDVSKYLELSREALKSEYFFIDETDDLRKNNFSNSSLHFALPYSDGSKDLIFIKNMSRQKIDGKMVSYLEGFSLAKFDSGGKFLYSLSVPFAKMNARETSVFDEETKASMGIDSKWKYVPFIKLQSVDRNTEGIVSKPIYSFTQTGLPEKILKESGMSAAPCEKRSFNLSEEENTVMILPMNYDDLDLLEKANKGIENMDCFSLMAFLPDCDSYGFAHEIFAKRLMTSALYPLFLLIFIMICATFSWKYRITGKSVFKFIWILAFPFMTVFVQFFFETFFYLFTMLDYALMAVCGKFALVSAFAIYVVILLLTSLSFVSRRDN